MKRANLEKRVSAGSANLAVEAVDRYLAATSEPARGMLVAIRDVVRAVVPPEAEEVFSYGMPGFRYKGTLLYFGAFKHHCGFFPGSPPLLQSLADELNDFKTSRGGIQFPFTKPLPVALIEKIVRLRVAENDARQKGKALSAATVPKA
jgi:uncharacterized protein YdhG (YjbR/CyaY superfamily)